MRVDKTSHRVRTRCISLSDCTYPTERIKRQRIVSSQLFINCTPKHYPSVFFDRRLRSIFEEE